MLGRVDYMGLQDGVNAHHFYTNVFTNVPRLHVDEVVYEDGLSQNGRSRLVRAEQKIDVLAINVLQKLSKPVQLPLDAFAGGHFLQQTHAYC